MPGTVIDALHIRSFNKPSGVISFVFQRRKQLQRVSDLPWITQLVGGRAPILHQALLTPKRGNAPNHYTVMFFIFHLLPYFSPARGQKPDVDGSEWHLGLSLGPGALGSWLGRQLDWNVG